MLWLDFIYTYLFWLLLPITAFWACRAGEKPEQYTAAFYIAAALMSVLVRAKITYVHVEAALFLNDLALLAALVWLVATSDRLWLPPSAALQGLSCLAHFAKIIEPQADWLGYQLMAEASGYPMILLLAIGMWARHRSTKSKASKPYDQS